MARIAFNRPEVRNAFRPTTVDELLEALVICHESRNGVVLITGEGPSKRQWFDILFGWRPAVRAKRGYQGLDGVNNLIFLMCNGRPTL